MQNWRFFSFQTKTAGARLNVLTPLQRTEKIQFFYALHYIDTPKKSGLSQNTDYHIPMYFDVLNTNSLPVWCHQPLIFRHSYHKRGKLQKRIYEEHQWTVEGIRTQLSHILMYFDSLNKNTLSIRSFYPLILCKSLSVTKIAEK